jgi:hypothetical protein
MKTGIAALFLSTAALNSHGAAIVGGWYGTNLGQAEGTVAFVFLSNGQYVEVEDGNSALDPSGQNGMERGTYTWDAGTGEFSSVTLLNTDGEWGLSDSHCPPCTVSVVGDTLTANTPDGSNSLTRIANPASAVVGTWYFRDNPAPGDLTVLVLLPNGEFLIAIDPPAGGFMEFGNYSWNPGTGAFTSSIVDSTAPPGSAIDLPLFTSAGIQNGNLVLNSASGNLSFANVDVPEPATFGFATLSLGLTAFALRRQR